MKKSKLKKKLSFKEKKRILYDLYGFTYHKGVLITDEGHKFYDKPGAKKYTFNTLADIFDFHFDIGKQKGISEAQSYVIPIRLW